MLNGPHVGRCWQDRVVPVRRCALFAATLLLITACAASPADRRPQVTQLTEQIRALPGVESASNTVGNDPQTGPSYFEVDVQVAEDISADGALLIRSRDGRLTSVAAGDVREVRTPPGGQS